MFLGRLLGLAVRAVARTWRVQVEPWPGLGSAIAVPWHGDLLALAPLHGGRGWTVIVSRSRDGDIAAGAAEGMGYRVVRGSSSRGGGDALVAALHVAREGGVVVIARDGPRGPARVTKRGAALVGKRTGARLVGADLAVAGALRLPSWDRMVVPLPFARISIRYTVEPPPTAPR
jgi:lysophospholipid acyltransferase (LPLAT)-like uncharacterized protein